MAMVHKKIKATAMELTAVWYGEAAHDNDFYKYYPNQKKFVNKNWKRFIDLTIELYIHMLNGNYPEAMKEEIAEVLILNRAMPNHVGMPSGSLVN